MRSINLLSFLLVLYLVSSCAVHNDLSFSEVSTLDPTNNSIEEYGQPVLKINPLVLRLRELEFVTKNSHLSANLKKHISAILSESNSLQDELLAASPRMIVVRQTERSESIRPRYLYQYDFERNDWICIGLTSREMISMAKNNPHSFYRSVYLIKRRNRVILKDTFGDISIIYVVQGKHHKASYPITSVWSPVDFETFITTANYIKDRIDPISFDIAKNNYQTIKSR